MKAAPIVGIASGCALLLATAFGVRGEVRASAERLRTGEVLTEQPKVAVANDAEEKYCTPEFKQVLQRVLNDCGLLQDARRGCQPADVKTIATMSDEDFNALFSPLKDRGAVVMFDDNAEKLDPAAIEVIDRMWKGRKGARYFFIVARASKTGGAEYNRKLSNRRANSVMLHLDETTKDPDLDKKVGMLWLGNEYAQLGEEYCQWNVSRKTCNAEAVNRSAFISWVDCQL
jgi:outer membrane protein OmpA-like peptidoglycan-associated protein